MCSRSFLTSTIKHQNVSILQQTSKGEKQNKARKKIKTNFANCPGCCKALIDSAWEDLHNSTRPGLKVIKTLKESVQSYVLSILEFHKQRKHGILPGSSPRWRLLHTQTRARIRMLYPFSFFPLLACFSPFRFQGPIYFPDYYPKGNSNWEGFGIYNMLSCLHKRENDDDLTWGQIIVKLYLTLLPLDLCFSWQHCSNTLGVEKLSGFSPWWTSPGHLGSVNYFKIWESGKPFCGGFVFFKEKSRNTLGCVFIYSGFCFLLRMWSNCMILSLLQIFLC